MRILRKLAFLAAPLLLAGCFLLPNAVSDAADAKMLNRPMLIETQAVSFERDAGMGLPERLNLAANSNTESLSLKNGKVMDPDSAFSRTVLELQNFLGDMQVDFNMEECSAVFITDSENPSVNMIVWRLKLSDPENRMFSVTIDDETGRILQLFCTETHPYIRGSDTDLNASVKVTTGTDTRLRQQAESLAALMTGYFGLPVTIEDYMFSGELAYYRADLMADGMVIPLYGVVRETGFSINERV